MTSNSTLSEAVTTKKSAGASRRKRGMRNLIKRGRIWYFKKMVHGKQAYISLETEDMDLAKAKRDQRLKQASRDEMDKIKGPRSGMATIGEIIASYQKLDTAAARIEASTITANVAALKNFLRWAAGTPGERNDSADVEGMKADGLTVELVTKFKTNYLATAGDDRLAREKRRRGAASWLRQARSLFSAQAQLQYKDLTMPDLKNFLTAANLSAEQRVHLPITNEILMAMDKAAELLRESNPDLWLVHALHKFCGLRNDEIAQVRVEWFSRAPWGQVFLSVETRAYYEPKGSSGHVPITTGVAQLLAKYVTGRGPADFLVLPEGTKSDRAELIDRTHAEWIRQFLPADKYVKAGYELRRWSAQVMETRYGRDAAEAFLRHAPKTVAERHYFERWYPWRRVGSDVGVTLEDARGVKEDNVANIWVQGADALAGLTGQASDQAASRL